MKRMLALSAAAAAFALLTPAMCSDISSREQIQAQPGQISGYETVPFRATGIDSNMTVTLFDGERIRTLSLHEYLTGVVAAEMPPSFPEEALKAQAVAARTFILYTLEHYKNGEPFPESHNGAQFCSDPSHCQAFCELSAEVWGGETAVLADKVERAVSGTDGVIALWEGEPIASVFCACAGGRTENSKDVWGGDLPYLKSVESPGDEECEKCYATVSFTAEEFKNIVLSNVPGAVLSSDPHGWFSDSVRSEGGGIITVYLGGVQLKGTRVRELFGLNSTNFTCKEENGNIVFHTVGYGHGVGMSQYGAKRLASLGYSYDKIIKWYYSGVTLGLYSE